MVVDTSASAFLPFWSVKKSAGSIREDLILRSPIAVISVVSIVETVIALTRETTEYRSVRN